MGRSRQLIDLVADAYKRADCESETDRFPKAEVVRYLNQGGAAFQDIVMDVRGREFLRKPTPQTITTTAGTTNYALSFDFYALISVRRAGVGGEMLDAFSVMAEADLREPNAIATYPECYELRRGSIELLPAHNAGTSIVIDYVPVFTDLVADADTFEGYDGWEDYPVDYAACRMLTKDEELSMKQSILQDMAATEARMRALAPKRDIFRARRPRDIRGPRAWSGIVNGRRW